jgi:putative thioredoxin
MCPSCSHTSARLSQFILTTPSATLCAPNQPHHLDVVRSQIRKVPTVVALFRGQMVDNFEGVPEPERLTQFFDAVAACDSATYLQSVVRKADEVLDRRAIAEAAPLFNQLLAEKASRPAALAGLARCAVLEGQVDVAESLLGQLRSEYADLMGSPFVRKAVAAVELASCVDEGTPSLEELEGALESAVQADSPAQKSTPQLHYQYATRLLAGDQMEKGIEQLIRAVRLDRDWEQGKAQTLLFKVFNSLGAKHELTVKGRKRLSNVLF